LSYGWPGTSGEINSTVVARCSSTVDDYVRLYMLAEHVYAGYRDYRVKTERIGRQLPIFRLTPR
jgi:hypothetical protein